MELLDFLINLVNYAVKTAHSPVRGVHTPPPVLGLHTGLHIDIESSDSFLLLQIFSSYPLPLAIPTPKLLSFLPPPVFPSRQFLWHPHSFSHIHRGPGGVFSYS